MFSFTLDFFIKNGVNISHSLFGKFSWKYKSILFITAAKPVIYIYPEKEISRNSGLISFTEKGMAEFESEIKDFIRSSVKGGQNV